MTLMELTDRWERGPAYRRRIKDLCIVKVLSRRKILKGTVKGKYALLKDEYVLLRLVLKDDLKQSQLVTMGHTTAAELLEDGQRLPPCFIPIHSTAQHREGIDGVDTTREAKGAVLTAYNQELSDIINLLFDPVGVNPENESGPISPCLEKLAEQGTTKDLEVFWAKSMNGVLKTHSSSVADINAKLHKMHDDAKVFDFPLIRQKLQSMKTVDPAHILF